MSLDPEPGLELGQFLPGGYEVIAGIGAGSFGRVYKARQISTGQDVAVKVLRNPAFEPDGAAAARVDRFRREMRLCAQLSHPNIVGLVDCGQTATGLLFAVFAYVPGTTLETLLAQEGRLSLSETVHLMTQVLDALSCAHASGVVHRDLKPANVMVVRTGARRNALVLDFGLGGIVADAERWALPRITATYELLGTPCYAAPEQLRGEPPTIRSDLYSWGLVFVECLTGTPVFGEGTIHDVLMRQLSPAPIEIPDWLRRVPFGRVLETVLEKDPERRTVTVEQLLDALGAMAPQSVDSGVPVARRPPAEPGERRQVTVVSCRLEVAAADARHLDIEELDAALRRRHAEIAELAARGGGELSEVVADRVLLCFGHRRAAEDSALRAARAALAVVSASEPQGAPRVVARAGIHSGLVLLEPAHTAGQALRIAGLTPQIAMQLEERARPGEVLVSDDTRRLLRDELAYEIVESPAGAAVFRLSSGPWPSPLESTRWTPEAPLAGRTEQLARLLALWARVEAGGAGVALLTGEPGIGKSRLVRELRRRIPSDGWLEARCTAESSSGPLRPLIDLLSRLGPLERLLQRYGVVGDAATALLTALRESPAAGERPARWTPDRQKELTLSAFVSLLVRMGQDHSTVLVVEDLQWADPTTLELIALLVQEVLGAGAVPGPSPLRLCVVLTARPNVDLPWALDGATVLQVPRLAPGEVETLVADLSPGRALPKPLVDRIVSRADGIPLFVEEVTRVLLDGGALDGDVPPLDDAGIPATLRDLLTARLDALSARARETTQVASVLGREVRWDVLHAVAGGDETVLRRQLRELQDAGLLFPRRSAVVESFVFKHALLRDAAYESMARQRRRALHGQVAEILVRRFAALAQAEPDLVAHHFEHAGDVEAAADWCHRAGERALRRAAYPEAIAQLEHGLALLEQVPAGTERSYREIELRSTLGMALFATRGYGAEEVRETFGRARALAETLGADVPLKVVVGIAIVHLTRGDREAATALLPRLCDLAGRADDTVASITGHSLLGVHLFWTGQFAAAEEHLRVGVALWETDEFQAFAREYGYDAGLFCHAYEMLSLWHLGRPDRAEALRATMTAIADASENPYSLPLALGFGACLSHELGDAEATLAQAARLASLATEQKLYVWLGIASCAHGGAALRTGAAEAAIAPIEQGLGLLDAAGARASHCYYLTYLIEAYLRAGRFEQGLATTDRGLELCGTLLAGYHVPELWRLRGELLRATGDAPGAERCFREALGIAASQGGRGYGLRAATSLARLLAQAGGAAEARPILARAIAGIEGGSSTRDVREAADLLALPA